MSVKHPTNLRTLLTQSDQESQQQQQRVSVSVSVSGDILILPDSCLSSIFQLLTPNDRNQCSLVCRRWLGIDGQTRHRLSLHAPSELTPAVPSLFTRFDSVTKLSLKSDRRSASIGDDALVLISQYCRNLTRLKLRCCRQLTDSGMSSFAKNCKGLKRLSCGSCCFGVKGIKAVVDNCELLEELSVKRLRGVSEDRVEELSVGPGLAALSLEFICLKDLCSAECFGPLIMGCKNLKTLKLFKCSGDWDRLLELVTDSVEGLVEVHLERLQMSDAGLVALGHCRGLEILHVMKMPDCSNSGLVSVVESCKLLRKLHVDGGKTNRINDEGLVGVSRHCMNLQELVLIGVNCTRVGLEMVAMSCQKLERLALCGSETVGDDEIICIAEKCMALKKLCVKSCPISDRGMEALVGGCPDLVKVKVKKCRGVTGDGASWLRACRVSLVVSLDTVEVESPDAGSDGVQDENPPVVNQIEGGSNTVSSSSNRSVSFKVRLGLVSARNLVSCLFRKWSSFGGGGGGGSKCQ